MELTVLCSFAQVWPVHKLVCGPGKANPFTPPDLSDEEIAALTAMLDWPISQEPETDPETIRLTGSALPSVQHIVERSVQLREGDLNVVRDNRRAA